MLIQKKSIKFIHKSIWRALVFNLLRNYILLYTWCTTNLLSTVQKSLKLGTLHSVLVWVAVWHFLLYFKFSKWYKNMISIRNSFLRQCRISTSRSYFTDNLGCVVGSKPDKNSDSFMVRNYFFVYYFAPILAWMLDCHGIQWYPKAISCQLIQLVPNFHVATYL